MSDEFASSHWNDAAAMPPQKFLELHTRRAAPREGIDAMPQPDEQMMLSLLFTAIYDTIKDWDVNVPQYYTGYMHATGSHAALIYNAVVRALDVEIP